MSGSRRDDGVVIGAWIEQDLGQAMNVTPARDPSIASAAASQREAHEYYCVVRSRMTRNTGRTRSIRSTPGAPCATRAERTGQDDCLRPAAGGDGSGSRLRVRRRVMTIVTLF